MNPKGAVLPKKKMREYKSVCVHVLLCVLSCITLFVLFVSSLRNQLCIFLNLPCRNQTVTGKEMCIKCEKCKTQEARGLLLE